MSNVFLYSTLDRDERASGERKKVNMQIDAFKDLGYDMKIVVNRKPPRLSKLLARLPGSYEYPQRTRKQVLSILDGDAKFIYIRKHIIDNSLIALLKEIKKRNIKVFLEIPTYPYDGEWGRLIDKPMLYKEKHFRRKLCKYVDKIVTLDDSKKIFGIPCINIDNGISKQTICPKKESDYSSDLHLLAVALFQQSHGYERLITGLADYYKKNPDKKVYFHMVGNGADKLYGKMIKENGLSEYIILHGGMFGDELNEMYDKCHIAIGALGLYKVGLSRCATLKNREYCAHGIPFVYSGNDYVFESNNFAYALSFPNNETTINIDKIIDFYNGLPEQKKVIEDMVGFAENNLEWKNIMKKITACI